MTANGDTAVIPARPVSGSEGEAIFTAMTAKKPTLEDLGVTKVVVTYVDNGVHLVVVRIVKKSTLDKILNTIEDEAVA